MPDSTRAAVDGFPASDGVVQACPLVTAAPDCATLADARDKAVLANHTYGSDPTLPPGYRLASPDELADLGVTPAELSPVGSDFRAEVFVHEVPGAPNETVVAFRGTQTLQDWKNNLQQGVGMQSDEYDRAMKLARKVSIASDGPVSFTGHSLGGGLASAAAVVTGNPATTFNAAGLNAMTVGAYPADGPAVDAYYVPGELLSALQDNRAAVLATLAGGANSLSPLAGGALAGFILGREAAGAPVLPQAYGSRHALPVEAPPGKSLLERVNPVDKHGMDWVQRGIDAQRRQLGCP